MSAALELQVFRSHKLQMSRRRRAFGPPLSGGLNVRQKQVPPSEESAPVSSAGQINAGSDRAAALCRRRRGRVLFILGERRAGPK